jgi:MFS family permease
VGLRDGLAAVRADRALWRAIQLSTVFWFGFTGGVFVGLPALAKLALGAGDDAVGLLYGATGAGALLGAVVAGGAAHIGKPGTAACAAVVAAGLALATTGLVSTVWAAVPLLTVAGAGGSISAVVILSIVQSRAPDQTRGRVMSVLNLGMFGLAPLAYACAGALGDLVGPRGMLAAAGALIAVTGLVSLVSPALRGVQVEPLGSPDANSA